MVLGGDNLRPHSGQAIGDAPLLAGGRQAHRKGLEAIENEAFHRSARFHRVSEQFGRASPELVGQKPRVHALGRDQGFDVLVDGDLDRGYGNWRRMREDSTSHDDEQTARGQESCRAVCYRALCNPVLRSHR